MLEIQRLSLEKNDPYVTQKCQRFRAIRLASLQDAPDAFGSTFEETAARPPESWQKQLQDLPTFIAVVDGVDSGVVRGAPQADNTAHLISLWVSPNARGMGIGSALIDTVVDWASAKGYVKLILEVGNHNAEAIALYTRKGFKPTGKTGHLPPPRAHILEHEMALVI